MSPGSTTAAVALCEILGIQPHLDSPRRVYQKGWEKHRVNASLVVASWILTIQDLTNQPIHITFHIALDNSPLTVGLDIQRYTVPDLTSTSPTLSVRCPSGRITLTLPVYVSKDSALNIRVHLNVIGLAPSSHSLMTTT